VSSHHTTKIYYPKKKHKGKKYDFTIVTGASHNHFCPVKGFLYHLRGSVKGLNSRLVVYDLGVFKHQQRELLRLMNRGYLDELRVFNYSTYPTFWNISEARGEYAWKPGIVAEVSKDYPGVLVWFDSGTLPERDYFENLTHLLNKYDGFLSPQSSGVMSTWVHPGVYDYYKDDASKYDKIANCNAATVAFDTKKVQRIIDEWYSCALDKDCIAPPGSNRTNHRQDQAILTYLVVRDGYRCLPITLSVHTHQDRECHEIIALHEKSSKSIPKD